MIASCKDTAWGDEGIRAFRVDHVHDHAGDADIDRLVNLVEPKPGEIVLDLLTGLGHVARAFAPRVKHVDAYDPDFHILSDARELTEKSGLKNIKFIEGVLADIGLPENHYDIIAARLAIRHLGDCASLIREANRILKPSGRIVISDCLAPLQNDLAEFQGNLMDLRDSSHVRSYSLAELENHLERENFDIDVIEIYPMEHKFESWAKRLGAKNENVRMLAATLQQASDRVKRHFRVIEKNKKLVSFVTWMVMIIARPAPER